MLAAVTTAVHPAQAQPAPDPVHCNDPYCVPGITPGVVLGAPCADTSRYVFATTSWGRLVFCGSPRRYEPRYFRSPSMMGIKELGANCTGYENRVAQAPDGLFLTCVSTDGAAIWRPGDNA
ncbi:Secreted protein [Mycobacterium sp. smrl_JER01]